MTITDAVTLGLVQGLTEFLPISSSGHLVIGQHLLHFKGPNIAFDIVLHLGTLLAVLVYFRQDLGKILYSFSAQGDRQWRQVALLVLLGTVPTGLIGFFFKDPLEALFSSVRLVALMLCVTGFLLFLADRVARTDRPLAGLGWKDALLIGLVQGLAIIPGISRSGSTISTGLYLKIEGEAAARFSFLLSIPAILGAVVLEGKDILGGISNGSGEAFFMGFITSALSGWLAIKILMEVVKRKRLTFFSIYCWLVAGTVFFLMV
jgi:undecaprenyl-diphosphatase